MATTTMERPASPMAFDEKRPTPRVGTPGGEGGTTQRGKKRPTKNGRPPARARGGAAPVLQNVPDDASNTAAGRRRLVADFCRLIGDRLAAADGAQPGSGVAAGPKLSPRMRQTLERLLAGDAEKQIARQLGLSPHTVHVYVKALYRRFDVCSRGELLAQFVRDGAARKR